MPRGSKLNKKFLNKRSMQKKWPDKKRWKGNEMRRKLSNSKNG